MTTNTPTLRYAEHIAVLQLLHSVPSPPSSNPVNAQLALRKGYTLSFEQERGLTGTLAFLSHLKDDPDHIPRICVEENPDSALLSVLLAVNKVKPEDGNQVHQNLKAGLESIFKILSRTSNGNWPIEHSLSTLIKH
jgi:hypothetical protein